MHLLGIRNAAVGGEVNGTRPYSHVLLVVGEEEGVVVEVVATVVVAVFLRKKRWTTNNDIFYSKLVDIRQHRNRL